ncbi:unnamed protein product [Tuber melanosporum]|uniref:(Perigord truffle) hypothetical protein n=1 Tax=Tuber melanosporum (strain Mel28) TaxID=656061 RepID=D5G4A0_TUBMM|nr:uncharacterized protein GSTUM_00004016001 [Tuber melanosporum]CAZ79343.1 unnamed protein product [Tuber melanosporum]
MFKFSLPRTTISSLERFVRFPATTTNFTQGPHNFLNNYKYAAAMSTSPQKTEWLCILPDQVNGGLERRLKVRTEHLEGIKRNQEAGFANFGGVFLNEPAQEGKDLSFRGSIIVATGVSKEAVLEVLKQDVYSKNDVWDWEKAEIYPFKTAIASPLPYV